jgi:hypothetical protein
MQTNNSATKATLQAHLKEIEIELSKLKKVFSEIKNNTKKIISGAKKRSDEQKISKIRKQLGIE